MLEVVREVCTLVQQGNLCDVGWPKEVVQKEVACKLVVQKASPDDLYARLQERQLVFEALVVLWWLIQICV